MHTVRSRTLLLEATSLVPFGPLIPRLRARLHKAGIWTELLDGHTSSAASLRLESPLYTIPLLYSALIHSGLHLHTAAHTALATLCSRVYVASSATHDLRLDTRLLPAGHKLGSRRHLISA